MIPIKKLCFLDPRNTQLYDFVKKITTIEEVGIRTPSIYSIKTVIVNALNLKSLRLGLLNYRVRMNVEIDDLNLINLNEARAKNNGRRMYLYMQETDYFEAKKIPNISDLSHIELKRII